MSSFKKNRYTSPVVNNHNLDLSKEWYVFFRFKHEGNIHKYKRREGINRIKDLESRLKAIDELLIEIEFDLRHGWNPLLDPKRERNYNIYLDPKLSGKTKKYQKSKEERMKKYL